MILQFIYSVNKVETILKKLKSIAESVPRCFWLEPELAPDPASIISIEINSF